MAFTEDIQVEVSTEDDPDPPTLKDLMNMTTTEIKTYFGNTQTNEFGFFNVIHKISHEIDRNCQNDGDDTEEQIEMERNHGIYIRMFEAIVDGLLIGKENNVWSAKKLVGVLTKPYSPSETEDKTKKQHYTVLSRAFKCRSKEIIRKLLKLLRYEFTSKDNKDKEEKETGTATIVKYGVIISGASPMTSTENTTSCLELLLQDTDVSNKTLNHAIAEVLDIEPIQKIEKFYNNVTTCVYVGIILLHAAYMSLFSYSSMFLMDKIRNGSAVESAVAATVIFYAVLPVEPVVTILFYIWWIWRNYSKFKLCGNKRYTFKHIIWKFSPVLFQLVFTVLVIVSIVQFVLLEKGPLHNTLSITLLLGWTTTLSYTQGVRPLRVFWKLIIQMIAIDVYKILFVYAFVLLSFSFALHIQFQLSQALIDEYPTPFHTMFFVYGLMLGVGELFTEEYTTNIREGGGTTVLSSILFILYSVIATLVLLNLLIAMMNTSYDQEISDLRISRRIDSLERALSLEETIAVLTHCLKAPLTRWFFKSVIKTGSLEGGKIKTPTNDDHIGDVWYVQVKGVQAGTKECQTPGRRISDASSKDGNLQLILELQNSVDDILGKLSQLYERMSNCTCGLASDTDA